MRRILVLCLDGLDHRIVEQFNMEFYLQKHYYTIDVSEYRHPKYNDILSPTMWASLINMEKTLLDWYKHKWIWRRLKKIWPGFKYRFFNYCVNRSNLLNNVWTQPAIGLFIPGINDYVYYHMLYDKALEISIKKFIEVAWTIHQWKLKWLRKLITKRFRLAIIWFDILDLLGHVYGVKHLKKLVKAYETVAHQLEDILKDYNGELIILSDHGTIEKHYPKAFFSSRLKQPMRGIFFDWIDIARHIRWLSYVYWVQDVVDNFLFLPLVIKK